MVSSFCQCYHLKIAGVKTILKQVNTVQEIVILALFTVLKEAALWGTYNTIQPFKSHTYYEHCTAHMTSEGKQCYHCTVPELVLVACQFHILNLNTLRSLKNKSITVITARRLCFHRCLSVHRRGGVCLWSWADTPRADTPWAGHPLADTHLADPPGQTPYQL